jgi:hypothetical protein
MRFSCSSVFLHGLKDILQAAWEPALHWSGNLSQMIFLLDLSSAG